MVQGKITMENTPTIRLGATASRLICVIPTFLFTPDALPTVALQLLLGLGQVPNMLARSGMVPSGWITGLISEK